MYRESGTNSAAVSKRKKICCKKEKTSDWGFEVNRFNKNWCCKYKNPTKMRTHILNTYHVHLTPILNSTSRDHFCMSCRRNGFLFVYYGALRRIYIFTRLSDRWFSGFGRNRIHFSRPNGAGYRHRRNLFPSEQLDVGKLGASLHY